MSHDKTDPEILRRLDRIERALILLCKMEKRMTINLDNLAANEAALEADVQTITATIGASVIELGDLSAALKAALSNISDPVSQASIDAIAQKLAAVHDALSADASTLAAANAANTPPVAA